jgi:hypothetical protein
MRLPKNARTVLGLLAGAGAVATAGAVAGADAAAAKSKGGPLRVVDVNVAGLDGVYQNAVIEIQFTADIDPVSVNPAVFQVRQRNSTGTGFTKQIPGSFQVAGNVVRFYPRLPTHLRDPLSTTDDFYAAGTPRDNANENAGLKPSTSYQVYLIGGATPDAIRSTSGRKLARSQTARFSTTPDSPKSDAFTIESYGDAPPPGFQYSNPSDKVASPDDQYAKHGGTREVPNAISVTLFGNRVPISPSTLRQGSNTSLTMTERNGDPSLTKPIRGTPFVEQNFDSTRIVFKPNFPLPDRGTYAFRLTKDVKDLTEQYDFKNNPERLRLREIYEFMRTAQQLSPGTPPADLPDPPIDLIFDWPTDPAARGVLKENILILGDTYPDEVDPRVMVLFSTRDEPVSNGSVILEFERNDGLLDETLSTASYDENVPGAAAALLTIAGGSGANGDYFPTISETINVDGFPNRTINWRKVRIPAGITVTIRGSRPATIKCFQLDLDGAIQADGVDGTAAGKNVSSDPNTITIATGGAGGPGGGRGGNSTRSYYTSSSQTSAGAGENGQVGVDVNGNPPQSGEAGAGGFGGQMTANAASTTIPYALGGGGGGGGARTAGTAGANSTAANYSPPWNGTGGAGGAGSANDDLVPLFGGAGGGAGGNGQYYPYYYPVMYGYYYIIGGGGGGGGGGAMTIQTAGTFTVGSTGASRARGGKGGAGPGYTNYGISGGPGGGGGGGSLLLRSSKSFNITNPGAATDVRGGSGGTQTGTYTAPSGGTGGTGYVRTEDPNATGVGIPSSSSGVYDPVGGGVPSAIWTKWIDLGVDGPRMVNFTQNDFILGAGGNDAILVEMQMAIEDSQNFGQPLLTALTPSGGTTNVNEVSAWAPVRVVDMSGIAGGAFGNIPGYNPSIHGQDYIFPAADSLNGFNYRFLRVRITFQLDQTQTSRDPFPFVDRMVVNFQFNI